MTNRRWMIPTLVGLVAVALVYLATLYITTRPARAMMSADMPQLHWLKQEFQLSDQAYQQAVAKYRTFDPQCQARCRELAAAQQQLRSLIENRSEIDDEINAVLAHVEKLRHRGREATLAHMYDVAKCMEPNQAQRYQQMVILRIILEGRQPHIDGLGNYLPHGQLYAE